MRSVMLPDKESVWNEERCRDCPTERQRRREERLNLGRRWRGVCGRCGGGRAKVRVGGGGRGCSGGVVLNAVCGVWCRCGKYPQPQPWQTETVHTFPERFSRNRHAL